MHIFWKKSTTRRQEGGTSGAQRPPGLALRGTLLSEFDLSRESCGGQVRGLVGKTKVGYLPLLHRRVRQRFSGGEWLLVSGVSDDR